MSRGLAARGRRNAWAKRQAGQRPCGASPGKLQEAIARIQLARNAALGSLSGHEALKRKLDRSLEFFLAQRYAYTNFNEWNATVAETQTGVESAIFAAKMFKLGWDTFGNGLENRTKEAIENIPKMVLTGTAFGGDSFAAARGTILAGYGIAREAIDKDRKSTRLNSSHRT